MATTTRFDAMTDAAGSRSTAGSECMTTITTIDSDTIGAAMGAPQAEAHALSEAEREICELMGIDPADYVRRRDAASSAEAVRVSGCPPRENEPSGRCADETAPSQGADPAAGSPVRSEVHDRFPNIGAWSGFASSARRLVRGVFLTLNRGAWAVVRLRTKMSKATSIGTSRIWSRPSQRTTNA